MDALTAFGLLAVTAMLVCYALESRSHWFILAFAVRAPWDRFTVSCKALGRLVLSKPFGPVSLAGGG